MKNTGLLPTLNISGKSYIDWIFVLDISLYHGDELVQSSHPRPASNILDNLHASIFKYIYAVKLLFSGYKKKVRILLLSHLVLFLFTLLYVQEVFFF